ncbi:hypothetical protein KK083_06955 [Fulvivirgaceae bacterium PWU4]|uniref:SMI1/KNR4 family protein n=1 Tax=Chryseosolibacter histidini TaxID=2782349 RepID=A0AAP2DJB1_9BACT|nr:hypothetical protein [Chryseosolibacter histidini]MBT1696604.1 hypothetical protein [Chryseosolibacter histidini]
MTAIAGFRIIDIIIILNSSLTMYSQDHEIQELYEKATRKISQQQVLGGYEKPEGLIKLEELSERKVVNLETIGFFLHTTKPYFPAPVDIIPFASTGGDGCYFAFVTDFTSQPDLENAPVLFVSPTDFDTNRPKQSNILFAGNFNDFLSIMTMIWNAEIIRFKDVTQMNFDEEIKRIRHGSGDDDEREKTIQLLHKNFALKKITNLNQYYRSLYEEREAGYFIKTIDGIGIRCKHVPAITPNVITAPVDIQSLSATLEKLSPDEKLRFYREAAYLYPYHEDSFLNILEIISGQMKKDGLNREAGIIDFEIAQTRNFNEYLKAQNKKQKR